MSTTRIVNALESLDLRGAEARANTLIQHGQRRFVGCYFQQGPCVEMLLSGEDECCPLDLKRMCG